VRVGAPLDKSRVTLFSSAMGTWPLRDVDWLLALLRCLGAITGGQAQFRPTLLAAGQVPPGLGHPLLIQSMIG
jgi:hypothetical protein